MDWDDSGGESSGSGTEEEHKDMWNVSKAVNTLKETSSTTRRSIRGLQTAIAEGWLIQRARDMCSFAHDRYRQAAQAEAESQPEEAIAKMSFRVSSPRSAFGIRCGAHRRGFVVCLSQIILMMLHELTPDIYRIADHAKR